MKKILIGRFKFRNLIIVDEVKLDALSHLILKLANEFGKITKSEIHQFTGFSLKLIENILSEFNNSELFEIVRVYDKNHFNNNIKMITKYLTKPVPSRECLLLQQQFFIRQYKITEKGKELLKKKVQYKKSHKNFYMYIFFEPFSFLSKSYFNSLNLKNKSKILIDMKNRAKLLPILKVYLNSKEYTNSNIKYSELIKIFEIENDKNAIWNGKETKQFRKWIENRENTKNHQDIKIGLRSEFSGEIFKTTIKMETYLSNKNTNFNEINDMKFSINNKRFDSKKYLNLATILNSDMELDSYLSSFDCKDEEIDIFNTIVHNFQTNPEKWLLNLDDLKQDSLKFIEKNYYDHLLFWQFNFKLNNDDNETTIIFPIIIYSNKPDMIIKISSINFFNELKNHNQKNKKKIFDRYLSEQFFKGKWQECLKPVKKLFIDFDMEIPTFDNIIKYFEKQNSISVEKFEKKIKIGVK